MLLQRLDGTHFQVCVAWQLLKGSDHTKRMNAYLVEHFFISSDTPTLDFRKRMRTPTRLVRRSGPDKKNCLKLQCQLLSIWDYVRHKLLQLNNKNLLFRHWAIMKIKIMNQGIHFLVITLTLITQLVQIIKYWIRIANMWFPLKKYRWLC
jgi:hypothetical protein